MKTVRFLLVITLMIFSQHSNANIKLPAIISDNMVLQQNTTVKLWGWADIGESVSVYTSWNKKFHTTVAGNNGKWLVELKTPVAGGPYNITFKGKDSIEIKNILIGEVWICSGQSNMHLPVGKFGNDKDWRTGVVNYSSELEMAKYPKIRLFTVDRVTSDTVQADTKGKWDECNPTTVADFSAVAYFFGRELYRYLEVPVGLVSSNWGGTAAESWMRKDVLENDTLFQPILDRYNYITTNYSRLKKEFTDSVAKWKQAVKDGKITGADTLKEPRLPSSLQRAPIGTQKYRAPSVLYNAMIAPLTPFAIKGVIWYQGENNADRAWQYNYLFPALIKNWREDWDQGNFPFYFVQIAPYRSMIPELREAQLKTYRSVPNTGIVVTTDIGDTTNIHPKNKQMVGYRLSLWALTQTYNLKNIVFSGPLYKSMKIEGDRIRLFFDYTGSGLLCKGDSLTNFTIAGVDKVFVNAKAIIDGNTVVVWAPEIKKPVAVRFGWKNVPISNFFNKEELPASPFRTDDWLVKTYGLK